MEEWLITHWWIGIIILPFVFWRYLLDAFTAPSETFERIRKWRKETEPVTLQYNWVEAIIAPPNRKGQIGVTPRVFLDNPHSFPIRFRLDTAVVVFHLRQREDYSEQLTESDVGAGARNRVLELPQGVVQLNKGLDSFGVRIILEFKYGRADVENVRLDTPLRISGEIRVKLFQGRFENRWFPDDYSDAMVQDPNGDISEDADGRLYKNWRPQRR